MKRRLFGNTGRTVSEIGLGTWQLGAQWGAPFNEIEARRILETAFANGINLFDTADVYNGGQSEKAIGEFCKDKRDDIFVVTKSGRKLDPHTAEMYTPKAIEGFVDESLKRLCMERLDMVLLHCPPTSVYQKDDIFTGLDQMKRSGKIAHYGVSIEKVAEGLTAMEYPISAIEVIFNAFRLKPAEELFPIAQKKQVGIIARVPLASGMLSGKYNEHTQFAPQDHRNYNRNGEAFDKGETFSGVDYAQGLKAVAALKELFQTEDLIFYALRWVLMFDAVSTVIPGASNAKQVRSNIQATERTPLTKMQMDGVQKIYEEYLRDAIHLQW